MKRLLFIILIPIILSSCVEKNEVVSNNGLRKAIANAIAVKASERDAPTTGQRAVFLQQAPYDVIAAEKVSPAKSEHFAVENAGFIVQASQQHSLKINEVVAFANLQLTKSFNKNVFEEVIFDNPANSKKPIIFEAQFNTTSRSSYLVSYPLENLKIGQTYHIVINFYADSTRNNLLESIKQTMTSPYDTTGSCLKYKFPENKGVGAVLSLKNHCIQIR